MTEVGGGGGGGGGGEAARVPPNLEANGHVHF